MAENIFFELSKDGSPDTIVIQTDGSGKFTREVGMRTLREHVEMFEDGAEPGQKLTIERIEMTQEEYDQLGEVQW